MLEAIHPIIVIEGPDGTGKTTLANAIQERLGASYRHLTYRWPKSMDLYHWSGLERCLRDAATRPVILDRWWPSEAVYAAAFRGGTKWPYWGRMLDRVALKHRIFYVLARPRNRQAYIDHFEQLKGKREEMYDSMTKVYDLFGDWEETMRDRVDFITYDFMDDGRTPTHFAHAVEVIICKAYDWFAGNHVFGQNILDRRSAGQLVCPDVLFVGDKSNQKTRRQQWPFFDRGYCSAWLTEQLQYAGIPEYKLAWINVHDACGKVQVTNQMIELIGARRIVAFGQQAAAGLHRLNVDAQILYHPQFYRRFNPELGRGDLQALAYTHNLRPENWNESAFRNLGLA